MTAAPDIHALDAAALTALCSDIASTTAAEWKRPTPCVGWTVTDLVEHMHTEHEEILAPILGPIAAQADSSAAARPTQVGLTDRSTQNPRHLGHRVIAWPVERFSSARR